ncbi:MAG: hypothetical protein BroJett041_23640 [Candidatus Jettenia caeni]|nr:MAG: hypothetical protein BroJett041_23640 [Candidatus Jettenia caeni]
MKPRLNSSKKWTSFPPEYLAQIQDVFSQAFAAHLGDSKLIIEGRLYPEEILLRVGYLESGRLKQNNFEVSMPYSPMEQSAVPKIHACIDAAASMMNEFFTSEEEVDFPRTWKAYEFEQNQIWLQYSTENTDLEAQANALLGEDSNDLVNEDLDDEDALTRAEDKIDTEEEGEEKDPAFEEDTDEVTDDEVPAKPSIFSGKRKKEDLH